MRTWQADFISILDMRTWHAHLIWTLDMRTWHAFLTCILDMHTWHAHLTCVLDMNTWHAHLARTLGIHTCHAHLTYTLDTHIIHTHWICTLDIHTKHEHLTCALDIHTVAVVEGTTTTKKCRSEGTKEAEITCLIIISAGINSIVTSLREQYAIVNNTLLWWRNEFGKRLLHTAMAFLSFVAMRLCIVNVDDELWALTSVFSNNSYNTVMFLPLVHFQSFCD